MQGGAGRACWAGRAGWAGLDGVREGGGEEGGVGNAAAAQYTC